MLVNINNNNTLYRIFNLTTLQLRLFKDKIFDNLLDKI